MGLLGASRAGVGAIQIDLRGEGTNAMSCSPIILTSGRQSVGIV